MPHDEDLIRSHSFILGEINGSLKALATGQQQIVSAVHSVDERLRLVESRSARNGLVAGGTMAVGVMIIKEAVKNALGMKG